MKWPLKMRKMWFKLTGKPVWYHRRCVDLTHKTYESVGNGLGIKGKAKFLKAHWVKDFKCPVCDMHVETEDFLMKRNYPNTTMARIDKAYAEAIQLEWDKLNSDIKRDMNLSKGSM